MLLVWDGAFIRAIKQHLNVPIAQISLHYARKNKRFLHFSLNFMAAIEFTFVRHPICKSFTTREYVARIGWNSIRHAAKCLSNGHDWYLFMRDLFFWAFLIIWLERNGRLQLVIMASFVGCVNLVCGIDGINLVGESKSFMHVWTMDAPFKGVTSQSHEKLQLGNSKN